MNADPCPSAVPSFLGSQANAQSFTNALFDLQPSRPSSQKFVCYSSGRKGQSFRIALSVLVTRVPRPARKGSFMRTQKQIAASRENGRKSCGATTPEGKARIVQANLQSGIFAETQVLTWEHEGELQELKDEYYARHPPASPEARCLLDQIVLCEWHLRRFCWVEDSLWQMPHDASPPDLEPYGYALEQGDRTFTRLQHRVNSTRRAFHAALKELERLEARDQDVVVVPSGSVSPATHSPQTP